MNILQAIKCKIGSHQWSEWRYIIKYRGSLTKSCEMERICNFCQLYETRQEQPHSWREWTYVAKSPCNQERLCNRCQAKDYRQAIHDWEDWKYKPNSCEQEQECRLCHQQDTKTAIHDWREWEYLTEGFCDQQRACVRCQSKETREEVHQWKAGEWEPNNVYCKRQLVCVRCQHEETLTTNHEWEDWEDETDDDDRQTGNRVYEQQCTRCGFTRTKEYNKRVQRDYDNLATAYGDLINRP